MSTLPKQKNNNAKPIQQPCKNIQEQFQTQTITATTIQQQCQTQTTTMPKQKQQCQQLTTTVQKKKNNNVKIKSHTTTCMYTPSTTFTALPLTGSTKHTTIKFHSCLRLRFFCQILIPPFSPALFQMYAICCGKWVSTIVGYSYTFFSLTILMKTKCANFFF